MTAMFGRLMLVAIMAMLVGCATVPPRQSALPDISPDAAHCLRLAMESGAYDEPPPECR